MKPKQSTINTASDQGEILICQECGWTWTVNWLSRRPTHIPIRCDICFYLDFARTYSIKREISFSQGVKQYLEGVARTEKTTFKKLWKDNIDSIELKDKK